MATTYEAIATVEVGNGGASSITFTSIPATFTDLLLKISARSQQTDFQATDVNVELNGSTANQSEKDVRGYAPSNVISQTRTTTILLGNMPSAINTANTFANNEIYVTNYASSNYKSISVDGVSPSNDNSSLYWWLNLGANLWSNSAAITSITLKANAGAQSFAEYSTATLYGIKNS
jgi:hypothetical protein